MDTIPFFSVIIPTFNRLTSLKRTLSSVLAQTFINYEIIIVDDGSTDGTQEYMQPMCTENSRVSYHWQKNSGLPSVARNKGIKIATGDWICFLDSDDYWDSEKLSVVYNKIMKSPDAILVTHRTRIIINGKIDKTSKRFRNNINDMFEELLLKGNFVSTSATCVKRDMLTKIKGFNTAENFYSVEDYDLWLRLAKLGEFITSNKILGYYTLDGQGISTDPERHFDNAWNVILYHINFLNKDKYNINKIIQIRKSDIMLCKGVSYSRFHNYHKAITYFVQSIKTHPFSITKFVVLILAVIKLLITILPSK